MPQDDTQLLQKMLELQQQQLAKLTEVVESFSRVAEGSQKSNERYQQLADLWEKDHKASVERELDRQKGVMVRGIISLIILALIPVAIIVAHFL
jgi:hypothetical protein